MSKRISCTGVAISTDAPGGSILGELSVEPGGLRFSGTPAPDRLPYTGLLVTRGGANNRIIFFSHPAFPGWSLYTRDKRIISALRAELRGSAEGGGLDTQLKAVERSVLRDHSVLFGLLAAAILTVLALWSFHDPITRSIAGLLPVPWEEKAGDIIFGAARTDLNILENEVARTKLHDLAAPLLQVVEAEGFHIKLFVMRSDDLNAFALPGGYVVVTTELIKRAERPEEVIGVLAHECSHVTQRHSVRHLVGVVGIYWVADLLMGNLAGTVAALSQAAPLLLKQSFSREHEREADDHGFSYLVKASINPDGMVAFFERVLKEQQSSQVGGVLDQQLSFLNTHPATQERIDTLRAALQALQVRNFIPQPQERLDALKKALSLTDM